MRSDPSVPEGDAGHSLVHRLQRCLSTVGGWWLGLSAVLQCALVVLLLLAKNGVDIELRNVQEAYLPGLEAFPRPSGYFSASLGNTALAYVLGADSTARWVALHAALVVGVVVLALLMAVRSSIVARGDALLLLASTTAVAAVLISIGKYDPLTFIGGWILVMARGPVLAAFGAVVMALGNPEQAVVAAACLVVITFAREFADWRKRALWSLGLSAIVLVVVQAWFFVNGVRSSRLSLLPVFLGDSLSNFLTSVDTELWSWFGAGWFVLLVALVMLPRRSRWIVAIGAIALPALVTISTADGGRVFGMVVLPCYVVIGAWLFREHVATSSRRQALTGAFILLLVLVPTTLQAPGWFDDQLTGLLMRAAEPLRHLLPL